MEIRFVEQNDLGEYTCHVSNAYGNDASTARLTFECKNNFMKMVSSLIENPIDYLKSLDSVKIVLSLMCFLVILFILLNASSYKNFACDRQNVNLGRVKEFIFKCFSNQCQP